MPNEIGKFGWLDVQGNIRDVNIGWVKGDELVEKVIIQNCGRALARVNNRRESV